LPGADHEHFGDAKNETTKTAGDESDYQIYDYTIPAYISVSGYIYTI
tara:strand:- start:125 stop:265 length:141 start_codon:yes stop_codon:yes gene_type:complete